MFLDKRNVITDYLHLDDEHFTHYVEMDNNVHVQEMYSDKILSKTIENTNNGERVKR